jgi:hypothetical protein
LSLHEYESIKCRDDSVYDLIIYHVAIRLFDGKASVVNSVQWFSAYLLALYTLYVYIPALTSSN